MDKYIQKYLLLILAFLIFIVGTVLYIAINNTFMSVCYMFIIFLSIALGIVYIYKKYKE